VVNSFYPDKTFYIFDKLVDESGCLCKIETTNPEKIYQRLDHYQDYTGRAFYYWHEGEGLFRNDIPNIYAPNTGNFVKALHHISLSIHFGIYLFVDVGNALQSPLVIKMLEQIVRKQSEHEKLLIFAGKEIELPEQMSSYFTVINHKVATKNATATNPKLLAS
jgi:hypothetical protein